MSKFTELFFKTLEILHWVFAILFVAVLFGGYFIIKFFGKDLGVDIVVWTLLISYFGMWILSGHDFDNELDRWY